MSFIHRTKAKRVHHAGYSFASKLESALYDQLWWRQKAKEITEIKVQATVYLTKAEIKYIPDFKVTLADGSTEYHEAKGLEASKWPMVKKLWKHYGPAPLYIWKGTHERLVLSETIIPEVSNDAS